jgi:hypothetical protein
MLIQNRSSQPSRNSRLSTILIRTLTILTHFRNTRIFQQHMKFFLTLTYVENTTSVVKSVLMSLKNLPVGRPLEIYSVTYLAIKEVVNRPDQVWLWKSKSPLKISTMVVVWKFHTLVQWFVPIAEGQVLITLMTSKHVLSVTEKELLPLYKD